MSEPRAYIPRSALAVVGLVLSGLFAAAAPAQQEKPSGTEVWAANCSRCHRMRAVDAYNASQWDAIVTQMALYARLTPDETEAVRGFLVGSAKARQAGAPADGGVAAAGKAWQVTGVGAGFLPPAVLPEVGPACPIANGEDIYKTQCKVCHGSKGKGDGPAAAGLNPRPSDLADPTRMAKLSDDSLVKVVTAGRQAMPGFANILKPDQIHAVVAHVRCLGITPHPPARDTTGSGSDRSRSR